MYQLSNDDIARIKEVFAAFPTRVDIDREWRKSGQCGCEGQANTAAVYGQILDQLEKKFPKEHFAQHAAMLMMCGKIWYDLE